MVTIGRVVLVHKYNNDCGTLRRPVYCYVSLRPSVSISVCLCGCFSNWSNDDDDADGGQYVNCSVLQTTRVAAAAVADDYDDDISTERC